MLDFQHGGGDEGFLEQCQWAARSGGEKLASNLRLAAVWRERDAEIAARLGEEEVVSYRFECKHCGSKFSLEVQRDNHQAECGRVGMTDERPEPAAPSKAGASPSRVYRCKWCEMICSTFAEYGRHRWEAHRDLVLAELAKKRLEQKVDERIIDDAIKNRRTPEATGISTRERKAPAPKNGTNGKTCPTCGGHLPAATAQLVTELTKAGIDELQAFEAARIARRIFAAGAAV